MQRANTPQSDRMRERQDCVLCQKNDKKFKEEAATLSDENGVKQAAMQLGILYNLLAKWRQKSKAY